jgi:hypothetical protein
MGGMIQALLAAVLGELARRGEPMPRVLATGGTAALLEKTLPPSVTVVPDLTLRGLAAAWRLNPPLQPFAARCPSVSLCSHAHDRSKPCAAHHRS